MALTKEQFAELRKKGLSVQQIIAFEQGKKPEELAFEKKKAEEKFLSKTFRGITEPVATLATRPFQAIKALGGATEEEQAISLPYYGKIKAPTSGKDVLADVGRAAETLALGVGGGGAVSTIKTGLKGAMKAGLKEGAVVGLKSGALVGIGGELQEKEVKLEDVLSGALKGATLGGILGGVAGGVTPAVVKAIPNPAKIMQRVARISKAKQANFERTAGQSVGDYLVERGVYGNIDDITTQLYKGFTNSKATADDALATLQGQYKSKPLKTALQTLLKRETKISSAGAPSPDLKIVKDLVKKYNNKGLTMTEINQAKRIYERNIKLNFVKQNLPDKVAEATNVDNALREWQFAKAKELGLKNLQDINKETRLAKQLLDDIGREYSGVAGNNAITLTDWIVLSGGDPTAVSGFLVKKLFSSKGIQSKIAKTFAPKAKEPIKAIFRSAMQQ